MSLSRFQVLSDAQWLLIEGMLPRPTGRKVRPFSDARTMVEAILYRFRAVADGVDVASPDGR